MTGDLDGDDSGGELREPEEVHPGPAARELLEALDHRRQGNGDRKGGQREVEPGKPECREAERKPEEPGDEAGDRDRPDVLHPAAYTEQPFLPELRVSGHEERSRVSPDRHERAVAERDLPGVPGQDVEAEERD